MAIKKRTYTDTFTGADNLAIPAAYEGLPILDLTLDARGTFNSGTVQAQRSVDGTNYVALGTGLTADGQEHLSDSTLGSGGVYRINTDAATDIDVTVKVRYGG